MARIKFCVVGMGQRGRFIAKQIYENNKLELISVCDNYADLSEWDNRKVATYKNYAEAISDPELDAVFIATPDNTHAEIVLECIKQRKHIICEKPLEITEENIMQIVENNEKNDKIFMLGYVLRYAQLFKKMKQLIQSGIIGRVIQAQVTDNINYGGYAYFHDWHREKKYSTSLLLQKASHSLDIVNWILDSKPAYVGGFGDLDVFGENGGIKRFNKKVDKELRCCNCSYSKNCEESIENVKKVKGIQWMEKWPDSCVYNECINVHDNQNLIIKYENNAKVNYILCQFSPEYKREFAFWGDKGKLYADDVSNKIIITYRDSTERDEIHINPQSGHGGGDEGLFEDFIECYYNKKEPVASFEEGANSALLALAAQKAIDENRIVRVKTI